MISPARFAAYQVLHRVEMSGEFCDHLLRSKLLSTEDERDRHLATELCYGTLRWQLALDDVLSGYCSRPLESLDPPIRVLLRMSLYQFWHTDRVPDHALVNDAVETAKVRLGRGPACFVNGVLRRLAREKPWAADRFGERRPDWVRLSLPKWLWDRWEHRYGREVTLKYAMSLNRPPRCAAWDLHPDGKAKKVGSGSPSSIVPGAWLFEKMPAEGHYWVQDEASQLVPHLMGPLKGRKCWDACAAPGGKAAILASLCGEGDLVVASDLRLKRIRHMKDALSRLKRKSPAVLVADAEANCPFPSGTFDVVLADVPCSGLGTLRRNPEIKWRFDPQRFAALQRRQLAILKTVSNAVRPGGTLVYSTCSTEPEENEQVIGEFLESHRSFHLGKPSDPPGVEHWVDATGLLRTFPSELLWDGFFAALMFRFS